MGFSTFKTRQMFIEMLLHILAHRDIKESTGRLSKFLHLSYTLPGPEKLPLDVFALWNMIKSVLDPRHEAVSLWGRVYPWVVGLHLLCR